MHRVEKHELPQKRIAQRLRGTGLKVEPVPSSQGYDFLVNGRLRVTIRVAFPSWRRHCVTVGGRRYQYRYTTWHFNFHQHGRLKRRYTDVFVCLVMQSRRRLLKTFVIPWGRIKGLTFSLHKGRRPYHGRYAGCLDQWEIINLLARAKE